MDANAPVKTLLVQLLGEKDFPIRRVRIPEQLLMAGDKSWNAILAKARERTPDATLESVLRAVLIYGTRSVHAFVMKQSLHLMSDGEIRQPRAHAPSELAPPPVPEIPAVKPAPPTV